MTAAICVPRWSDNGRRDQVWEFVEPWIRDHFDYPLVVGEHPGPGEARALAAEQADADVLIFWDSDTLAHPEAVETAVMRCVDENRMVLACDSHMYMSKESSDRIMYDDMWFPRPYTMDRRDRDKAIYARPCSGVYAIPRSLYEACGGYPALGPEGFEDLVWFQLTSIMSGNGPDWVEGHITLHLWHPPAQRTQSTHRHPDTVRNKALWQQLARTRNGSRAIEQARAAMAAVGHVVP
ncbi:glycosyltransferase [Mycobacteroides abscessus]|uniref:glycosyltransferase n=1 Tax=Mycobacteroides abscessus TaxID=36809 RepID=UPI0009C9A8FA|nr:glycosyltransferase [Mycobacteroides abscessus]SLH42764.1 Glycosyl transferase family 2 [Mycobacteroides abscessus subsp. abscessus]